MFDFFSTDSGWPILIVGILAGFVLIIFGGDYFVDSAIWLAKITHIPAMMIGATVVSIGTTLPELFVSYMAAAGGQTAMAVGNATGSILCNLTLILGLTMAFSVAAVDRRQFLPKFVILGGAVAALALFAADSYVGLWENLALGALFVVYMTVNIVQARKQMKAQAALPETEEDRSYRDKKPWLMIVLFVLGAAGIALGANLLVDSISAAAGKMGVSEQIISLTVVAIGTSLPELVTAITSLKKNNTAISMGNILGANILNATLITGGSGLIAGGLTVAAGDFFSLILTVATVGAALVVLALPVLIKGRSYRWQGFVYLTLYALYLLLMILQATGVL